MVRKLKSCGFTSFHVYQWEVRYKTRCDVKFYTSACFCKSKSVHIPVF